MSADHYAETEEELRVYKAYLAAFRRHHDLPWYRFREKRAARESEHALWRSYESLVRANPTHTGRPYWPD